MPNTSLPSILTPLQPLQLPRHIPHMRLLDLRSAARFWTGTDTKKLSQQQCERLLIQATEDKAAGARVVQSLSAGDRGILAVFRRHGNTADGSVLRIELLTRGLIEELRSGSGSFVRSRWKRDPIAFLADKLILRHPECARPPAYIGYRSDDSRPFPVYLLPAAVAGHVSPAGPSSWTLPPLQETVAPCGCRTPAEAVLDLAAVYRHIAARGGLGVTASRQLALPNLRTLARTVALPEDPNFPLTDAHVLWTELLRGTGCVTEGCDEVCAAPELATWFFSAADAVLMHALARAWIHTPRWLDGVGMLRSLEVADKGLRAVAARQVLAWALDCLAQAGGAWFSLAGLVRALHELHGGTTTWYTAWATPAWDPKWDLEKGQASEAHAERMQLHWFKTDGRGLANALMVTLPALGLIERGQAGRGKTPNAFRLTPLGRAVFGAPEQPLPPEPDSQAFLVVQPNFDVIAYLDRAGARMAGFLGRVAETASRTGSVQSFRLTQDSVYHALENGVTQEEIRDFLARHNQGAIPPNVLQTLSDWGARRESLVLRDSVTLLAFPDRPARDAWAGDNKGTPCGEHFVLLPASKSRPIKEAPVWTDHDAGGRQTLHADEEGVLTSEQPLDLVQQARLARLAEPMENSWRLTAHSVAAAVAGGLKGGRIEEWLEDHVAGELPPLLYHALQAWQGQELKAELGDAAVLHVADLDLFHALADSARVQPFLHAVLGPGWFAVRREGRKELAALLAGMGVTVGRELMSE